MKSARVVVLAALVMAWQVPPAVAGTLLQSAERLARQAGQMPAPAGAEVRRSATGQQSTPSESGMSKRKKVLIVVVAAVATAGAMWAIDHGVVDNTPSSRGTRKD